ncbi:unnamed protein product, partial [Nesidiocoris tenuis]
MEVLCVIYAPLVNNMPSATGQGRASNSVSRNQDEDTPLEARVLDPSKPHVPCQIGPT